MPSDTPVSSAPSLTDRDKLTDALREAAELEHGLLLQYLFAAFTIKQRRDEGLTHDQLELACEVKRALLEVAREEMAHLGIVCSVLVSVGAKPHFRPPTLPAANRFFGQTGPDDAFSLEPLSVPTMRRFVRFEAPEPAQPDAAGYSTVGGLYRDIQRAIVDLDAHGGLFVRDAPTDDVDAWGVSGNTRFGRVRNAASAVQAIDRIIEQGEGADGNDSHYVRFGAVHDVLAHKIGAEELARPVLSNPGRVDSSPVDDALTSQTIAVFERIYSAMLSILSEHYTSVDYRSKRGSELRQLARGLMSGVVRPLGEVLCELPSGQRRPGMTAGPSFRCSHVSTDGLIEAAGFLRQATTELRSVMMRRREPPRLAFVVENVGLAATAIERLTAGRE